MQPLTNCQITLSHPAEAAARLAMADERLGAIDERLADIQQRLQVIDRVLAATTPTSHAGSLAARLGNWLTALSHRSAARPLGTPAPAGSSLS